MAEMHSAQSEMNGAAIVLSDGREIPITHTMVQNTLKTMAEEMEAKLDNDSRENWEPMPLQAHG